MTTPTLQSCLGRCQLGIGRVDITPPPDAYHRNWGAALHDRAEGIHRPLMATCLVLSPLDDPADLHVVFGLDLGWMRDGEMASLLASLAEITGCSPHQLIVTFSHTHAGINLDRERADDPGGEHIAPYLEALPTRCSEAYVQAISNLAPVDISLGMGHCDLAVERDFRDTERDIFVCGPNPAGESDDTLVVLRADGLRPDDVHGPRLVLGNYACHPTTLAWGNRLISPDYIGAMRELVEQHVPATCLFLQGAAGNLGPAEGFVGDPAVADRNGRQLGHAILSTLEGMPPAGRQLTYQQPVVSGATVGVWSWETPDPARSIDAFVTETLELSLPIIDLPTVEQIETDIRSWQQRQTEAGADTESVRECRARIERCRRMLRKVLAIPAGTTHVDVTVWLWRIGECVWVMLGGEPYQQLQLNLRRRFPGTPLVIVEMCNTPQSYMLPRERYGIGLYQEEVATLAPGCLEALEEAIAARLHTWGLH